MFLISSVILVLIIGLFVVFYYIKISFAYIWRRYKHFFFTLLVVVIAYFLITETILYFERISKVGESPLLDLSTEQFHHWLLILILSGYENDLFPISVLGKFLATLAIYLGWVGLGVSILFEYLTNIKIKK